MSPARRRGMRVIQGVFLAAVTALGLVSTSAEALAAPSFQLPFTCGQKWRLDTWDTTHAPALDMVREPDQQGTEGALLVAPADGTVNQSFLHGNAGNVIQINHGDRHFTTYIHLQSRAVGVGTRVRQGQTIGRVGHTGETSNGHPHLHYEQGFDSNGNGSASWGAQGSERVAAVFDGTTYGPGAGRTWRNVASRNCGGVSGTASIYGALSDGRLTYTAVNAATGVRTHGAVTSTASLGFTPTAMATLNFNTILVTSPEGVLYRVDVITNNESLSFNTPVNLGGGWTHRLLAYDGSGSLFGIAGESHTLRRYTVSGSKPGAGDITGATIDAGFALKTLTTAGPDWLLGTTDDGKLLSYRINGVGDWSRFELKSSTWQVFDNLVSPGGGVYFGLHRENALHRYLDDSPFDGSGADLRGVGTVDESGWTQQLLSAQPGTVS